MVAVFLLPLTDLDAHQLYTPRSCAREVRSFAVSAMEALGLLKSQMRATELSRGDLGEK